MRDLTRVVHHPAVDQRGFASLSVPLQRASTIVFASAAEYARRKDRGPDGYSYGLHGTPTTKTLEAQLSALEHAVGTILVPSGQAAIALVFLTALKAGDAVLVPKNVYPPVIAFCSEFLAVRDIAYRLYDPAVGADVGSLLDDTVRLLWIESPGSVTMEVADVPALVAAARARGVLTGCDNTWATPLLFKPLDHGVDFAVEALTKYVGGHSDLLLGSISVRDSAWYERLRTTTRHLGIGVSPDECSLALRGLETLGIRLAHIGRISIDFARRIAVHPAVSRVLHPALPDAVGHAYWRRDFAAASGVFGVVVAPDLDDALDSALSTLRTFAIGASWGGTRSLIAPVLIGHQDDGPIDRRSARVLRISIGLEDPEDLWADIERLLDHVAAPRSVPV